MKPTPSNKHHLSAKIRAKVLPLMGRRRPSQPPLHPRTKRRSQPRRTPQKVRRFNQRTQYYRRRRLVSDDDLLERLSQAAKKSLKPPTVHNQPVDSPRRPRSPAKAAEIEWEDPDVDIDTIEPPARGLETDSSEELAYQTWNTNPKPVETTSIRSTPKSPIAHVEKELKNTDASAEILTSHLDVPRDITFKPRNHLNTTQVSTRLQTTKNPKTYDVHDQVSMDSAHTKKSTPIPTRPTRTAINKVTRQQHPKLAPNVTYVKTYAPNLEESPTVSPETSVQFKSTKIIERIQPGKTRTTIAQTVVRQVETPPIEDTRRTKFPLVSISGESDVEMETFQEQKSYQANVEPIRRSSILASQTTPTIQPVAKPQFHPIPAPTKVKHAAVTRVLFNTGTQPSPKSALASPQRRTLPNGTRPSVSFLEPPAPIARRGSSSSSTEGIPEQRSYCTDHENLREGHSARTGDVILQITDIMMEIQEVSLPNSLAFRKLYKIDSLPDHRTEPWGEDSDYQRRGTQRTCGAN
ncbi:hypothetical protein B0J17DRAFT_315144 [Rhizoctonia solani]|nr:hypothetical protein B0J17DRAFT_315144 [Rhizoctonia solani]